MACASALGAMIPQLKPSFCRPHGRSSVTLTFLSPILFSSQTTSWSATGIGRSTLSVILASLSKGGHLRVGMEDVLTISRGVPVESNAQLVERAVAIGALAQRLPMTPAQARELIGVRA